MGIEEKKQPKIEVISEYSDIEKDIRDSDTFENKKEETLLDAKNLVDKIKQETNKKVEFIYSYSGAGESDKKKTEEIKSYTNDEIYKTLDELKVEIKTLEGKFKESGYVADREEIESKILEKEEKIRELEEEKGIKSSVGLAMKGNIAWDGSVKSQKISDITSKKEIKISELEKEIGDIEKENEEIAKNSPKGWLDSKVVENRKIQDEKKQEIEKLKEEPPKTEFKMEVDCAPMIKSKISESKDVNELEDAIKFSIEKNGLILGSDGKTQYSFDDIKKPLDDLRVYLDKQKKGEKIEFNINLFTRTYGIRDKVRELSGESKEVSSDTPKEDNARDIEREIIGKEIERSEEEKKEGTESSIEKEGALSVKDSLDAARVFGFIGEGDMPEEREEKESLLKVLNLEKKFSKEAISKAIDLSKAEKEYLKEYKDIASESKKLKKKIADVWAENPEKNFENVRKHLKELNVVLEKDEKISLSELYKDYDSKQASKKIEESFTSMEKGGFRNSIVKMNMRAYERKTLGEAKVMEELSSESETKFIKKIKKAFGKWNKLPRVTRAAIGAAVIGGVTAATGGLSLIAAGGFVSYKIARGSLGALFGGALQGIIEKNFLKVKLEEEKEEVYKKVEKEFKSMGKGAEYNDFVKADKFERIADKNIEIAKVLADLNSKHLEKINKKDKRRRIISMVGTGLVGGAGGVWIGDMISGGFEVASAATSAQGMFETSIAGKGDSVWVLIKQNLSANIDGFENLSRAKQNFVIGQYTNVVVDNPARFGLTDPDMIKVGYGKQLSSLFTGPNALDYSQVLTKVR